FLQRIGLARRPRLPQAYDLAAGEPGAGEEGEQTPYTSAATHVHGSVPERSIPRGRIILRWHKCNANGRRAGPNCPQLAKPSFFQRKDRIRARLETRIPLLVVAECQTREAFDAKG